VATEVENYEFFLGTMTPASVRPDQMTIQFVGRVLDIVFVHFEAFLKLQSLSRLETPVEPEAGLTGDLQLWLVAQFLAKLYSGSLCEISEVSLSTHITKVLANSAARPWEPAPWEPAKSLEMLSGYSSLTGVPLVVDKIEYPITLAIESIEPELRFLKSQLPKTQAPSAFSAIALPVTSSSGESIGALYILMPRQDSVRMDTEVRTLAVFSRIVGEIIERQRSAMYSARVAEEIVTTTVLQQEQFIVAVLDLLNRKANDLRREPYTGRDIRLPFLLLSAYQPDPDEYDTRISGPLRDWLVRTLRYLEWRSFIRVHLGTSMEFGVGAFIGEVPGVGMMIALGELVSKDNLDRIRSAFPSTINRVSPTNSPVKLVAWVLDVPAKRILDAAEKQGLPGLANEIVRWAFEVTTLVNDVAQSAMLAHEQGEWDAALHKIRQAFNKQGGHSNAYLRRLAAECCFSLGDWPGALRYSQEAARLSRQELGSGLVRSLCLQGDAYLCVCEPLQAWDSYSEASSLAPNHPLPRYYRGQALLLIARLMNVYEHECWRKVTLNESETERLDMTLNTLVNAAMEDLTSAADLLDHWGLIPESYQYRNFHLVPTLIGQSTSYLLARVPGPAASRLQSARRSFPKDDLFFREFLFAKCWEQGVHRQYAALLLGDGWQPLGDRLHKAIEGVDSSPSVTGK
jgi:tetratricopeptide (TPR) repeat protein